MPKNAIRIECNPYTKRVKYFWKNDGGEELWSDLSESKSSPFAKSKPSYKGFAEATIAHKAYEILSVINTQYNKGKNGLEIVVDGTQEDIDEFCNIIAASFPDSGMECKPGDLYMLTAKEVMPQIESIFSSLGKILSEYSNDEIGELIARYSDAVKPEMTLCVMGLYSSGKSAFINSLIGKEILPSATNPLTAKIFKINCEDSVWVEFQYDGIKYRIDFLDNDWRINASPDADLVDKVIEAINSEKSRENRLYLALTVLNEFAMKEGMARQNIVESLASDAGMCLQEYLDENSISSLLDKKIISQYRLADLIEIGIPFSDNTILPIKDYKFVVFDTPGSDSEMHREHAEILEDALKDRTNGLPIFVTDLNLLDRGGNSDLIKMIETAGESLDGTSTMIVINKADAYSKTDLKAKSENYNGQKVTSWKASRIYFLSSIISLGQKIEKPELQESWMDQGYADIYYDNYSKFDGSDVRRLLELFKYNIIPQNIQNELERQVEQCTREEKILWNSGIRSIESEIGRFGERFALYNKCVQAEKYLEEAIAKLTEKMESINGEIEKTQTEIEEEIEGAIKDLGDALESKCEEEKSILDKAFKKDIVGTHVKHYIDDDRIRGLVESALEQAKAESKEWKGKKHEILKNSTKFVKYVKKIISNKYDNDIKGYATDINQTSDMFWEKGINELKETLLQIVYESQKLTKKQKEIAKDAVMESGKMKSTHCELKLGEGAGTEKKSILGVIKWDEFNSSDAQQAYLLSLKSDIEKKNDDIKIENTKAFGKWKKGMTNLLKARLSQLNPRVIELNKKLIHQQELGDELAEQIEVVEKAKLDIIQLLSFREAE